MKHCIDLDISYLSIQHLFPDHLLSVCTPPRGCKEELRENVCFLRAHSLGGAVIKPIITLWNKGLWVSLQELSPSVWSWPHGGESLASRRKRILNLGSRRSLTGLLLLWQLCYFIP